MDRRSLLAFAFIALMVCCCAGVPTNNKGQKIPDTPEAFVARFGQPDEDDSTENDNPRPLQLTRWQVYKAEGVRVFYIPHEGHKGNTIPVAGWQLLQFQDNATKAGLSIDDVSTRLAARDKTPPKPVVVVENPKPAEKKAPVNADVEPANPPAKTEVDQANPPAKNPPALPVVAVVDEKKNEEPPIPVVKLVPIPPSIPKPTPNIVEPDGPVTIGKYKVSIESGSVGKVRMTDLSTKRTADSADPCFLICFKVENVSKSQPIRYAPWGYRFAEGYTTLTDDSRTSVPYYRPIGKFHPPGLHSPTEIKPHGSILDSLVFSKPSNKSRQFTLRFRSGLNQSLTSFVFEIQREFFAKDESEQAGINKDRQVRRVANDAYDANEALIAKAEDANEAERKRVADAIAAKNKVRLAIIRETQDAIRAKEDAAKAKEVARLKAVEDAKPKVTRANFSKVTIGMGIKNVESILGYGKEVFSTQNTTTLNWRDGRVFITIGFRTSFEGWVVSSKSIID